MTLYLGDEQQAIFSFIGAKLATLEWLRERCGENMHRLYFNYRSPKYLLDVFNTYANMELDVDPHFLPKTNNLTEAGQDSLCIMAAPEKDDEVKLVAESVGNFCTSHPDERVAVLVPWNKDADQISHELTVRNIPPLQDFRNRPFHYPTGAAAFRPSAGGVLGFQHDGLVKDPDRDRYLQ